MTKSLTKFITQWVLKNEKILYEESLEAIARTTSTLAFQKDESDQYQPIFYHEDISTEEIDPNTCEYTIQLPVDAYSPKSVFHSWKHSILMDVSKEYRDEQKALNEKSKSNAEYIAELKQLYADAKDSGTIDPTLLKSLRKSDSTYEVLLNADLLDNGYIKHYKGSIEKAKRVTAFANMLPSHKKDILINKFTGEEYNISFKYRNQKASFLPMTHRSLYSMNGEEYDMYTGIPQKSILPEYENDFNDIYLTSVRIEPLNQYGLSEKFNLDQITEKVDVYHTTKEDWETIFYVTDENLEPLYDALIEWRKENADNITRLQKQQRKAELEEKLKTIQDEIDALTKEGY